MMNCCRRSHHLRIAILLAGLFAARVKEPGEGGNEDEAAQPGAEANKACYNALGETAAAAGAAATRRVWLARGGRLAAGPFSGCRGGCRTAAGGGDGGRLAEGAGGVESFLHVVFIVTDMLQARQKLVLGQAGAGLLGRSAA